MEDIQHKKKDDFDWQKSLLPFMSRTIVVLSIFFFLASLVQLIYMHATIADNPRVDLKTVFTTLDSSKALFASSDIINGTRLKSLVVLENGAMENQYFQANMLLMGRLWTSYIGFVTGMIMAIVGATFILGKLREPVSDLSAKTSGNEVSFKTASPGLLLAVLGTGLMITTLVTNHRITASHAALYLHDIPMPVVYDTIPQPVLRSTYPKFDTSNELVDQSLNLK